MARRGSFRTETIIETLEPLKLEEQGKQEKLGYDGRFFDFAVAMRQKVGKNELGRLPTTDEALKALEELVGDTPHYKSDIEPHTIRYFDAAAVDGKINMNALLMGGLIFFFFFYEQKMRDLFVAFDENNDKKISREEARDFFTTILTGVSFLVDGILPKASRNKVMPVFGLDRVPELVDMLFASADTDKDDFVTIEEWEEWSKKKDALYGTLGTIGDVIKGKAGMEE